jgi:hypothetical protein
VAWSQYHLAVAGECEAIWYRPDAPELRLRTHPLPRGGTDSMQLDQEQAIPDGVSQIEGGAV